MPKMARVKISFSLLEQLLKLPDDIRIKTVTLDKDFGYSGDYFTVVLEGEGCPNCPEGAIPEVVTLLNDGGINKIE